MRNSSYLSHLIRLLQSVSEFPVDSQKDTTSVPAINHLTTGWTSDKIQHKPVGLITSFTFTSSRNNMESREDEEDDCPRSLLEDETSENITAHSITTCTTSTSTKTTSTSPGATTTSATPSNDQKEEEEAGKLLTENFVAMAATGEKETEEETTAAEEPGEELLGFQPGTAEVQSEQKLTPTTDGPGTHLLKAPPASLALSGPRPPKKKVLVAPALSLSLGRSESTVSEDFPSGFLSPSPVDDDDVGLDLDLDALETPSDTESLPFPIYDLEDDLQRLGIASRHRRLLGPRTGSDSQTSSVVGADQIGLEALEREDMVDSQGTRWRCFSTGDPPQESRVNMSVLEPFLQVLSHGGYYGDGMNDIIVFSSCYLPENSLEYYQYVMDHLFRYVVGTLDLMVAENYVIVYLCAGGQKDKVPGISWLRECYTTIDRRLRKNLKGFYVVHPTWYIKALITIIKPFISSKFSRKLQFVSSLQELSRFVPTEHVQIPDCVRQYDQRLTR
ncbi:bcl-2/adenovirus E1B 19 kDa-interacting protein 2-like protein isoform X2 [Mastacembelus armatus]|uniref:bcl-2/adenovirus E1B 19 kDa-interacting protein 2-like protein isoform X2 n=1 Tax=Mastacembelus armatus TaxID=205130 RepID=UPI000E4659EB|nr:bcl-2/adenovirus E1B 19 kDa-interacting protein 2-like protein isoform X2 [Mastacembelus armatus]